MKVDRSGRENPFFFVSVSIYFLDGNILSLEKSRSEIRSEYLDIWKQINTCGEEEK